MRFCMMKDTSNQEEYVVAEAEPQKPRSVWRRFDPAYIILMITALLAITYSVRTSRQNSELQAKEREQYGTLSGPPVIQEEDIVPAFKTIDIQNSEKEIVYNGTTKYLLFVFSPMCGVCQQEIPLWNSIASIAASKEFAVCGISLDSLDDSRNNLKNHDIGFDVFIMPDFATQRAYRVTSIPQVMIVSEHGRVEWVHYGAMTQSKVKDLQSRFIGKKQ